MRYAAIIVLAVISALFAIYEMNEPAKWFGIFAVIIFLYGDDDK